MNSKLINGIVLGLTLTSAAAFAVEVAATGTSTADISTEQIEQLPDNGDILSRLAALEANSKKSDWSQKVKIKADMRYRFEYADTEYATSKNRQRIRARLGAYADVNDFTTAGIRISTGKDANSGNQTIGDNFDGKGVYLDLAYITLAPQSGKYGEVTLGKMLYPWKNVSALIWDGDVNPEGIAYNYSTQLENTGLFGSIGGFKVADTSATHDLNLISAQAGLTQPLCDSAKLTGGVSLYAYDNAKDFVDPSTGTSALNYAVDYRIAELFSEIAVKDLLPTPVKFYGNYVNNTATGQDKQGICAGIKFGDAKKGKWEAKAEYRYLEENAAPSYYSDSDFVGGGTDVRGAGIKAAYNLGKHLQLGINANAGQTISNNTDKRVVLLDLVASF